MKGKFRAVLSVFLVIAIAMSLGTSAFTARKKTQTAADIADQMAKNSAAWHEADEATKKQLEAENAALRQQYAEKTGDNVTYDPATGKTTATNKKGETTYKNESTRNEKTGRMDTSHRKLK